MLREAGILDDNRATGGEITAAPVAEPAGVQPDVLVFGDGEFAFRTADVIAIEAIVRAEIVRSAETPAVPDKFLTGLVVLDIGDRKSTRLNSSHLGISYAVFCLKKKKEISTE